MPAFSRACLARKLAIVVVGSPATPLLKSRVRFCISAAHDRRDLEDALRILDDIGDQVMVKYKSPSARRWFPWLTPTHSDRTLDEVSDAKVPVVIKPRKRVRATQKRQLKKRGTRYVPVYDT
jgi:serine palmitoyltransferase